MILHLVVAALTGVFVVESVLGLGDVRAAGRMRARLGSTDADSPTIGGWRPDGGAMSERSIMRRGPFPVSSFRRVVDGALDRHRRRRSDRRVPDLLDGTVRQLRSGATLRHALERVGGASDDPADRRLADDLATGGSLSSALDRWRADHGGPNHRLAAVAVDLAASAGGATARVLDGVAETLRDRVALDREVIALSTQARASAAVLVVAPIGFALLAVTIDHRLMGVLLSPVGIACVVVGLGLDALGGWWMHRLVRGR